MILFSTKMKADKNYAKKLYVLLEKDYKAEEAEKARSINKDKVYDVELVLEGVLTQELDFEKHKIRL